MRNSGTADAEDMPGRGDNCWVDVSDARTALVSLSTLQGFWLALDLSMNVPVGGEMVGGGASLAVVAVTKLAGVLEER